MRSIVYHKGMTIVFSLVGVLVGLTISLWMMTMVDFAEQSTASSYTQVVIDYQRARISRLTERALMCEGYVGE